MDENDLRQLIELFTEYDATVKQLNLLKAKLSIVRDDLKNVCSDVVEQMTERQLSHVKVVSGGEEYIVSLFGKEFPLSVIPVEGTVFLDPVSGTSTQS